MRNAGRRKAVSKPVLRRLRRDDLALHGRDSFGVNGLRRLAGTAAAAALLRASGPDRFWRS